MSLNLRNYNFFGVSGFSDKEPIEQLVGALSAEVQFRGIHTMAGCPREKAGEIPHLLIREIVRKLTRLSTDVPTIIFGDSYGGLLVGTAALRCGLQNMPRGYLVEAPLNLHHLIHRPANGAFDLYGKQYVHLERTQSEFINGCFLHNAGSTLRTISNNHDSIVHPKAQRVRGLRDYNLDHWRHGLSVEKIRDIVRIMVDDLSPLGAS